MHKEVRISELNYSLGHGLTRNTLILAKFSSESVLCALEIVPYSHLKYLLIFHGR